MATPQAAAPVVETREARIAALMDAMRPQVEQVLREMAERVVDLPEHEEFGAVEYEYRDAGQRVANTMQQAGLQSRKKRGT
jgi:YD repeat-containing protein